MSADWFTDPDAAHDPEALERALAAFAATDWAAPERHTEAGLRAAFDGVQAYAWAGRGPELVDALRSTAQLVHTCLAAEPTALWPLQGLLHLHQLEGRYDTHEPGRLPALERLRELEAHTAGRGPEAHTLADVAAVGAFAAYERWRAQGAEAEPAQAAAQALEARVAALEAEARAATPPHPRAALLLRTLLQQQPGLHGRLELQQHLVALTAHDPAEHAHALFDLGMACYESGLFAQAEAAWQQAQVGYAALGPEFEVHLHQTESWREAAAEAQA